MTVAEYSQIVINRLAKIAEQSAGWDIYDCVEYYTESDGTCTIYYSGNKIGSIGYADADNTMVVLTISLNQLENLANDEGDLSEYVRLLGYFIDACNDNAVNVSVSTPFM